MKSTVAPYDGSNLCTVRKTYAKVALITTMIFSV